MAPAISTSFRCIFTRLARPIPIRDYHYLSRLLMITEFTQAQSSDGASMKWRSRNRFGGGGLRPSGRVVARSEVIVKPNSWALELALTCTKMDFSGTFARPICPILGEYPQYSVFQFIFTMLSDGRTQVLKSRKVQPICPGTILKQLQSAPRVLLY
jgi:hypothetical protein